MNLINVLILLIFNSILWGSINSVKNKKDQKLNEETNQNLAEKEPESSANPQSQKYKNAKPTETTKNIKGMNEDEKKLWRANYWKDYSQKNKERLRERKQKYNQDNKEKRREYSRKYTENNERKREYDREYVKNNKEKRREYMREYRLKKKNEKRQKDCLNLANIQSDNDKGNLHNDCVDKGNNPIVCEKNDQEENDSLNQGSSQKYDLPHIEEGNSSVNQQTDVNPQENPHEEENVQMENSQQLNELNDLDYLKFLSDINYLDNLNFLRNCDDK
ncbi:unnamed protein product [Meloidogyne enterolobii]|uniref:Uncharacterized protein n=1 Tax=Meloidogyne enterolobii TaxID=390850 RepID=A0ACB0XUB1_MELEN